MKLQHEPQILLRMLPKYLQSSPFKMKNKKIKTYDCKSEQISWLTWLKSHPICVGSGPMMTASLYSLQLFLSRVSIVNNCHKWSRFAILKLFSKIILSLPLGLGPPSIPAYIIRLGILSLFILSMCPNHLRFLFQLKICGTKVNV